MMNNKLPRFELLFLIIGELLVSAVIAAVYLLLDKWE